MDRLHAHTPNDKGEWHYLDDHLKDVADKAKKFADKFGASDVAYALGLIHDLGKVNPMFQDYLDACARGQRHGKVPHSIWGAALAYAFIYRVQKDPEGWKELSLSTMGHHGGLADCGIAASKLDKFLEDTDPLDQMQTALRAMKLPLPSLKLPGYDLRDDSTWRELFIRMLFSALVDADYLDTEKHFDSEQAKLRGRGPSLDILWKKLEAEQGKIINDSTFGTCQ